MTGRHKAEPTRWQIARTVITWELAWLTLCGTATLAGRRLGLGQ